MDDCCDEPKIKIENDWDFEYLQHLAPDQIIRGPINEPKISNERAGQDIPLLIKDDDSTDGSKGSKCFTDNFILSQPVKQEVDQTESESITLHINTCSDIKSVSSINGTRQDEISLPIKIEDHAEEQKVSSCLREDVLRQQIKHDADLTERETACDILDHTSDETENESNQAKKNHSNNKKSYKCDICLKIFARRSSLSNHRITHTGETPFTCPFCQKSFNVRSNLNVHLRIHTGQKPHLCEICEKSFTQAGQLKTHLRIHKGEKPYTCSTCQRSFRNTSGLKTHQRTHTGEKPFPCDLCTRSFSTSTSLKTHRVTHTGTMLFDCPVCGRQFNRRNNLNVHIKRHDKNRSFPCPICSSGFVMRAHLRFHLQRCHDVDVKADTKYRDLLGKNGALNDKQEPFIEIVTDMKSEPEEITSKVDLFKSELA